MQTMGDWFITFEFNRMPRRIENPLEEQYALEELIGGFWLDANHRLVREPRGKYFIPASRIILIERKN